MKRGILFALLLATGIAAQAALTIHAVQIVQTSGATAEYTYNADSELCTIEWSAGALGHVLTDTWNYSVFNDITVNATLWDMQELSSGGVAKAQFTQGVWSMELGIVGELGSVIISGDLNSAYTEKELLPTDEGYDPTAQKLDGRAVVNILDADFSFLGGLWQGDVVWGNANDLGGLIASVLFPTDYREITDYQTDYLSENVQITLLSDDQAIPEPATLSILGLGSLLMLKKRKA